MAHLRHKQDQKPRSTPVSMRSIALQKVVDTSIGCVKLTNQNEQQNCSQLSRSPKNVKYKKNCTLVLKFLLSLVRFFFIHLR